MSRPNSKKWKFGAKVATKEPTRKTLMVMVNSRFSANRFMQKWARGITMPATSM